MLQSAEDPADRFGVLRQILAQLPGLLPPLPEQGIHRHYTAENILTDQHRILPFVFVLPEKQNRGVGRALIGAIERDPWFLTARRVIIPASINALHFYQGLGYTFAPGGDMLDEEQLYCLEKFPQPRT